MALTLTEVRRGVVGDQQYRVFDVDFDASYPTGGESLSVSDLRLTTGVDIVLAAPKSGYLFQFDHSNLKLQAFYGDYSNAADGVLIEVPNTTDLSAVTNVRIVAYGR